MFGFLTRKPTASRSSSAGRRRSRRAANEVAHLESRSLLSTASPITVTEAVNPLPTAGSRGRPLEVQVSGTVTDSDTAATLNKSLAYTVLDTQTGHQVGRGTATIAGDGSYAFDVRLHVSGLGRHHSGAEQFSIAVMATDSDGNSGTDSAMVGVTPNASRSDRGGSGGYASGGRHGRGWTLESGGAGQDQSNSVSVPGSNDTVTQNVSNYESNTYNVSITTTTTTNNNAPPPPPPPAQPPPPPHPVIDPPTPPPPPGPPPQPGPPGPHPH